MQHGSFEHPGLSDASREALREGPVVVLTGAGVSVESGLSTFRGEGGLWEGRDPMSLATPEAFRSDPELVWRFYAWRREQAAAAEPNAGHRALARLGAARGDVTLLTQNVDGLHERAGSDPVVRLHGSLWQLRCTAGHEAGEDLRTRFDPFPPCCDCGALLRPGVVWFGEALPGEAWAEAHRAAAAARAFVVAGTSALVYPAAALPDLAREHGARLIEVNPQPTPLSDRVDDRLAAPAAVALPFLVDVACAESTS